MYIEAIKDCFKIHVAELTRHQIVITSIIIAWADVISRNSQNMDIFEGL
jgi:hypothetical protein